MGGFHAGFQIKNSLADQIPVKVHVKFWGQSHKNTVIEAFTGNFGRTKIRDKNANWVINIFGWCTIFEGEGSLGYEAFKVFLLAS